MNLPLLTGILSGVGVVALDQLTKRLASDHLPEAPIILISGYFDLTLVHNRGAAFGLFSGLPDGLRELFLISIAVIVGSIFINILRKSSNLLETLSLGMILGGAVGNLIDRLRFGWVVDFIHLHWHDLSWPVFNIADSAISVGVVLLAWDHIRLSKSTATEGTPS